jgi:predicted enzyme related to lactoylglutathione lyase
MFERLDFVYMPSRDVAREMTFFIEALGGRLVFAIEAFGTRVAMLELAESSPAVLLAGHLEGERPVLVYRVDDLEQAIGELEGRGAEVTARFEIPHGPVAEMLTPGPQRIALYELTRPQAHERLAGRRDF